MKPPDVITSLSKRKQLDGSSLPEAPHTLEVTLQEHASSLALPNDTSNLYHLGTSSISVDVVSPWLLLYVFTKAKHKTHQMITQTQKDDSSCFDDVMQLRALPDIAHSGLSAVALDVKKQQTTNSTEYVRIHPVRSHSVSVVTRAHNARSYDVDHGCMKSKPVDVNVPAAAFN